MRLNPRLILVWLRREARKSVGGVSTKLIGASPLELHAAKAFVEQEASPLGHLFITDKRRSFIGVAQLKYDKHHKLCNVLNANQKK